MKSATTALLTLAALAFAPAFASDTKPAKGEEQETQRPRTSQQEKMKTCNVEAKAKDLHGDERRAFMSTCLKG